MRNESERKLESLLAGLFDDEGQEDVTQQIAQLLTDEPWLRDLYWKSVGVHTALAYTTDLCGGDRAESERSASVEPQPPATTASTPRQPQRSRRSARPHRSDGTVPARPTALGPSPTPLLSGYNALAVMAMGAIACITLWSLAPRRSGEDLAALLDSTPHRIPSVTHVSWEGPVFASHLENATASQGTDTGKVTLHQTGGFDAEGYLLCLPPRASLHLVTTADATGENSLSVFEIGGANRPTTKRATFNNSGNGAKPKHANPRAVGRRYGVLGSWSETNDSDRHRYFLLTGVHKRANPTPGEDWRLSSMHVMLEEPGVAHIGWDDSGPAPPDTRHAYSSDNDFDDLSATIRIHRSDKALVAKPQPRVAGDDLARATPPEGPNSYRFTLARGESAVLKGASEATLKNQLVVTSDTGSAQSWEVVNDAKRKTNLGVRFFYNDSDRPQQYTIFSRHVTKNAGDPTSWTLSLCETLFEQSGYAIVGFDDEFLDGDYDDVRVSVLKFPSDRAGNPVGE